MTNTDPLDTNMTSELSCNNEITAHFVVFGRIWLFYSSVELPSCRAQSTSRHDAHRARI